MIFARREHGFRVGEAVWIKPECRVEFAGRHNAGKWEFRQGVVTSEGNGPNSSGRFVYVRWDGNTSADSVPPRMLERVTTLWGVEPATSG